MPLTSGIGSISGRIAKLDRQGQVVWIFPPDRLVLPIPRSNLLVGIHVEDGDLEIVEMHRQPRARSVGWFGTAWANQQTIG